MILVIVYFICVGIILLTGVIRQYKYEEKGAIWQSLIVAATLLAVATAQLSSVKNLNFSERNLNLTKKQISLQLRPFITVVNPIVIFNPDNDETRYWMSIVCGLQNFGLQPAHEYKKKNDRLLRISFPPDLRSELEKIQSSSGENNRTQKDNALLNIIQWRKETMERVYEYLQENPMASSQDIDKKFKEQHISCYGDVCKYFDPPTVISPKQIKLSISKRDAGENYGQAIASGHEAFMYFLYLTYEGSIAGKEYSTFYICYYDEYLNKEYKGDALSKIGKPVPLSEYRQWMDREGL